MAKHRCSCIGGLGVADANAGEIIRAALEEAREAASVLDQRQAAEKAYLAMITALQCAYGSDLNGHKDEARALERLRQIPRYQSLSKRYDVLAKKLHRMCFYNASCGKHGIEEAVKKASEVVLGLCPGASGALSGGRRS